MSIIYYDAPMRGWLPPNLIDARDEAQLWMLSLSMSLPHSCLCSSCPRRGCCQLLGIRGKSSVSCRRLLIEWTVWL